MQSWDGYRAIYGAELRAAAREPSELPDGWVQWRVSSAQNGWELPTADVIPAADAPRARLDLPVSPGAQRPVVGMAVGMRS